MYRSIFIASFKYTIFIHILKMKNTKYAIQKPLIENLNEYIIYYNINYCKYVRSGSIILKIIFIIRHQL